LKQQKNGGGGGARNRAPQNDYSDRSYSQQSYTQPQGQHPQTQAQAAPPAGSEDPYAACKKTLSMIFDTLLTNI